MYIRDTAKYDKMIRVIHPGEYYVSNQDEIIGTLLGSCVAVCLSDTVNGVAGMNHFMLPGRISETDIFSDRTARYGITAINKLLEEMWRNGARRESTTAKIFGGGHVLESMDGIITIPADNVRLARVMMEFEDIHITGSDTGDNFTRKIMMVVKTGKVYLRKSTKEDVFKSVLDRDQQYVRRSYGNGKDKGADY